MHHSGFSLQQIANVTKHKNLDSLKHYVETPTLHEKQTYNEGLFNYGNPQAKKRPLNDDKEKENSKRVAVTNKENIEDTNTECQEVAVRPSNEGPDTSIDLCSVVTNQMQQAPNMFQNANFNNCNFNFTLPH